MARTWRIGALARETGLTVRTLHYYDSIGLVSPSARTSGGHRLYSDLDVNRLYIVVVLRRMGMSIAHITAHLAGSAWDLHSIARFQYAELDEEIATLGALRHRIEALLASRAEPLADLIKTMQRLSNTPFVVRRALALLPYNDVEDAQRRLVDMFKFEPGPVERNPDGTAAHATVLAGTGFVHLHPPTADVAPPGPNGRSSAIVVSAVANVDLHSAHAVEHGARITYGPLDTSYGLREYGAQDHAGHHWSFQSPLTKEQK